tara:strand:- start:27 stop:608 length:582 start_codon:yes stop_codon:yes gene_type:complete
MIVLLIGYNKSRIRDFLEKNTTLYWIDGSEKITLKLINKYNPNYIILHGCHSILSSDIIKKYKNHIINCHGAYLPYNRGAHPNVWSFIDNTPKGGTIQYITENIDDGDILVRDEVDIRDNDTLATVYWRIRDLLEEMFILNWEKIINKEITPTKQNLTLGKVHYRKDLKQIKHLLTKEWDTPIQELLNLASPN